MYDLFYYSLIIKWFWVQITLSSIVNKHFVVIASHWTSVCFTLWVRSERYKHSGSPLDVCTCLPASLPAYLFYNCFCLFQLLDNSHSRAQPWRTGSNGLTPILISLLKSDIYFFDHFFGETLSYKDVNATTQNWVIFLLYVYFLVLTVSVCCKWTYR